MLHTRFTEMFGLEHPVMSAPMAMHTGGTLAGAVSATGGLGTFGGIHSEHGPEWVGAETAKVRAATDRPFGIGFITPFLSFTEPYLEAALAERPAAIVVSFADPGPWSDRVKSAGAKLLCQVQDLDDVDLALAAGADVLVVQGTEAGGHTGSMTLLPFLADVVDRVPGLPVIAAGGIADGRTMAAALAAGADGVSMGTAFLATPEVDEVSATYKDLIIESDGHDTVLTHAYDIVSGLPWPEKIHDRVRANRFTHEWAGRDAELGRRREEIGAGLAKSSPDPEVDPVRYGQSAAFVDEVRPASDVVLDVAETAEAILRERPGAILR